MWLFYSAAHSEKYQCIFSLKITYIRSSRNIFCYVFTLKFNCPCFFSRLSPDDDNSAGVVQQFDYLYFFIYIVQHIHTHVTVNIMKNIEETVWCF